MTLGIGVNPLNPQPAQAMADSCRRRGLSHRLIDLTTLGVDISSMRVADAAGEIEVTHLAPTLFYWQEAALTAYRSLEREGALSLNSPASVLIADDKAETARLLSYAGVPQLRTFVLGQDGAQVRRVAEGCGFPLVLKRTHGAEGRWVRLVENPDGLLPMLGELVAEGPGAMIVQELAKGTAGQSIRVLVLEGTVLAASRRIGPPGSFVSNVGAGGSQHVVELDGESKHLAIAAARGIGLGFAGVDLIEHHGRPVVLEVNATPGFTSMIPLFGDRITDEVVDASLRVLT